METPEDVKPDKLWTDLGRDWTEDFSHENGNYFNVCIDCKETFRGHKRRPLCKICHEKDPDWEKIAQMKKPEDNSKCAYRGCWSEGEMVGVAKCMVQEVGPLRSELTKLREENERLNSLLKKQTQLHIALLESQLSKAKELIGALVKLMEKQSMVTWMTPEYNNLKQFLNEIS